MAYEFVCSNGECINGALRCDGNFDCADGIDELGCSCERDQLKCRDGSCINIALRCNGFKDCHPDGEDEYNCGT